MEKDFYFNNCLKLPTDFIRKNRQYFNVIQFESKGKILKTTNRRSKRKEIIKLRKNTNLNRFTDQIFVNIILGKSTRIEIQTHKIVRKIIKEENSFTEIFECKLINLIVLSNDSCLKFINTQMSGLGYSYYATDYPQSSYDVFKNTELKYSGINKIVGLTHDEIIQAYKYKDILEILNNLGNLSLISEVIGKNADMRVLTPQWIRRNKPHIKKGLEFKSIMDLDFIKEYYTLNDSTYHLIKSGFIKASNIKEILSYEKKNKIKKNKLLRYLDKQHRSLYYYEDYIRMLKEEYQELVMDWKRQFPKHLDVEHDRLVDKINERRRIQAELKKAEKEAERARKKEEYAKIAQELKKLEVKDSKYAILVPSSLEEIIEEGDKLAHCVGGTHYTDSHLSLKTIIMFVRDNRDLSEPLFTLELFPNGKIKQLHGYGNEAEYKGPKAVEAKELRPLIKETVERLIDEKSFARTLSLIKGQIES